jgi:hypothetical protein
MAGFVALFDGLNLGKKRVRQMDDENKKNDDHLRADASIHEAAQQLGSKGGVKRRKNLTPLERHRIAKIAAKQRWENSTKE